MTALHMASSFASWPVVEALLEMGANPSPFAVNGLDPLMCQAAFGRATNITRWCARFPKWDLKRGRGVSGGTALFVAIFTGTNKLEAVQALVNAGANPLEFTAQTGQTVLHTAASNKDATAELIRFLLDLPGVRALVDKPLVARSLKWKARFLAARLLVKLGTKKAMLVNVSEWSMLTPLITAARNGNVEVMKVLVEEGGADLRPRNARGHTALDLLVGGKNALEESRVLLGGVGAGKGEGKEGKEKEEGN